VNNFEALLARAEKYRSTARNLIDMPDYESSASRSYYAMFYATQAVLLTKGIETASHNGAITLFSEHFVKTEIFPREMSRMLSRALAARQMGDYDVELSISRETALQLCETSTTFIQTIGGYLRERGFLDTFDCERK
jgi:uncharacterized protein (UPF0332 family)